VLTVWKKWEKNFQPGLPFLEKFSLLKIFSVEILFHKDGG